MTFGEVYTPQSIDLNMPILRVKIQPSGWGVSSKHTSFWSAVLCDIEGTREPPFVEKRLPKGTSMVLPGYLSIAGQKSRAWRSLGVWVWEGTRQLSWKAPMVLSTMSTVSLAS